MVSSTSQQSTTTSASTCLTNFKTRFLFIVFQFTNFYPFSLSWNPSTRTQSDHSRRSKRSWCFWSPKNTKDLQCYNNWVGNWSCSQMIRTRKSKLISRRTLICHLLYNINSHMFIESEIVWWEIYVPSSRDRNPDHRIYKKTKKRRSSHSFTSQTNLTSK